MSNEDPDEHATPEPPVDFPDQEWDEEDWFALIENLREDGFFRWEEVALLILKSLNPPQVGTAQASSEGFKENYGKGNTMRVVMDWLYSENGRCEESGTRLSLQVDHEEPKNNFDNPNDADVVENLQLLSRRENVIRRESHVFGGQTHLPAAAALMWILLEYEPRTLNDFIKLCRLYGMTMADIRMQEGWAMGHWLAKDPGYDYEIEGDRSYMVKKRSQVLKWEDNALTRKWEDDNVTGDFEVIVDDADPSDLVYFVIERPKEDEDQLRVETYRKRVASLHFSHYFEDDPKALTVNYSPPNREAEPPEPASFPYEAPRGKRLLDLKVAEEHDWSVTVSYGEEEKQTTSREIESRTSSGNLRGGNGLKIVDLGESEANINASLNIGSTDGGQTSIQFDK